MKAGASALGDALAWLEKRGSEKNRAGMARYGITAKKALGVSVGDLRAFAKKLGRDHVLADALWRTGIYEARLLAVFVDDPKQVTPAQMDRWARSFENWADCDTACFHLFDKTPYAFDKVHAWADRGEELVRRAAFALLASVALHDKKAEDAAFLRALPLIERASTDARNFVKKGVSWALRGVGRRRPALFDAAALLARRLAASADPTARWIGRDALRDLERPPVRRRLASRSEAAAT